jgi:hypothetical protein
MNNYIIGFYLLILKHMNQIKFIKKLIIQKNFLLTSFAIALLQFGGFANFLKLVKIIF